MHISCERCILRSWRADDLDSLIHHANNPRIAENMRDQFPHPYTRADGEAWLGLTASMAPGTALAIEVDSVAVGGIGLKPGSDVERIGAEVGYWLGESFWGRGIATSAVRELTRTVLERGDFQRLFALPFAHNLGSRRVLERSGYQLEGILRHSAIKNGIVLDQALYACIAG